MRIYLAVVAIFLANLGCAQLPEGGIKHTLDLIPRPFIAGVTDRGGFAISIGYAPADTVKDMVELANGQVPWKIFDGHNRPGCLTYRQGLFDATTSKEVAVYVTTGCDFAK